MSSPAPASHTAEKLFQHRLSFMVLGILLLVGMALALGALSLQRFQHAEHAWEAHNQQASRVSTALTGLRQFIGYGGFIHNFKNLILRRDIPRYQSRIEADIRGFRQQIEQLYSLLDEPGDQAALLEIKRTFAEYASKYTLVAPMVEQGASSAQLDALVKVNDDPALKAFETLKQRSSERARRTEIAARNSFASAQRFALLSGSLIVAALLAAGASALMMMRRLIAASEQAHHASARLDTLLDSAPDPMLTVNTAGQIVRSNHMAEEFFGYSAQELRQMRVEQLIPERFRTAHVQHRAGYFAAPRHRPMGPEMSLHALTRDGREPCVQISLSWSGDGEHRLASITLRDVTAQEENRLALLEANRKAEAALALQLEFQSQLVKAEKLAALGGLVAGVAHEINTPLGNTLTTASHLEMRTRNLARAYKEGELSEEELQQYLENASESAHLLTLNAQKAAGLIQGFKQLAVDRCSDEQRSFELKSCVEDTLLSLLPLYSRRPIQIRFSAPDGLLLDSYPGALSQLLSNLITNSLTHAFKDDEAGEIHIKASTPEADTLQIDFADNGCGIPASLHNKVFDPFFTTNRKKGGSGLGLHIAHNIAESVLGGSLTLLPPSIDTKATHFKLQIPMQAPALKPERAPQNNLA